MTRFFLFARGHLQLSALILIALFLVLLSLFPQYFAPHDPLETNFEAIMHPPDATYPLGTDQLGRCMLSRIVYGGRTSLFIALAVVCIVATTGISIGIVSGYAGGFLDTLIMRACDSVMAFPEMIFIIALVSVLGPGLRNTVLAISLIGWTYYARISRSLVLSIKNNDYINAAKLGGANTWQVATRYIAPNVIPFFVVWITQDIGSKLLSLAGLSLLSLASQPPTPEWGFMLSEGKGYMQTAPWLMIFPGLAILLHVVVSNLLGDILRDLLDPYLEKNGGEIL